MVQKVEDKVIDLKSFVEGLPKVELHVHIEGTFEPSTMIKIAERNSILSEIVNEGETNDQAEQRMIKERENFTDLQDFLRLYNQASRVLKTR